MGSGSTCGVTLSGSCYNEGPCCVYYKPNGYAECFDGLSINECINLGNVLNNDAVFGGVGLNCSDVYCDGVSQKMGACCDGLGGCENKTESDCINGGGYFLGVGSSCKLSNGIDVCSGGTGACCTLNECVDEYSGTDCINNNYLYAGHGSLCLDVRCDEKRNTKNNNITSLNLQMGDIFGGGMVVGLYRPTGSVLHGNKEFGGNRDSNWQQLMMGGAGSTSNIGYTAEFYRSSYDYNGYGFTSDRDCSEYNTIDVFSNDSLSDAYYIITSLSPIAITGDREVVNLNEHPNAIQDFYWGNKGSSWGPIYNKNTTKFDDLNASYGNIFGLSEGYWYVQGITGSVNNIPLYTFPSCKTARRNGDDPVEKILTKSPHSAHGLWHRNWGLYNNIRIISADNALSQGYNISGAFSSDQFGPGLTASYVSAFRAARLLPDNLSATGGATAGSTGENIPQISQWFIPSHDELAFIAEKCLSVPSNEFNLNSHLLSHEEGIPFNDWYWTSTGAFDETKGFTAGTGEGIININETGTTADPGSLAWAIKFDISGDANSFEFGKKNRTQQKYKVRPIRIIRVDGLYATGGQENEKLWRLPKVLRDSDLGINQD